MTYANRLKMISNWLEFYTYAENIYCIRMYVKIWQKEHIQKIRDSEIDFLD